MRVFYKARDFRYGKCDRILYLQVVRRNDRVSAQMKTPENASLQGFGQNYSIKIFYFIYLKHIYIYRRFYGRESGMAHKIILNNRNQGNLPRILDVISFDENTIVLDTDMGLLTIKGKDLHVNRLSLEKGEIDIEGRTDSLVYSAGGGAKSDRESFFAKLFK